MNGTAHPEPGEVAPPSLYVVATPIGNLGDITLRALEVLKRVALIAAEDTRVTAGLTRHYGIDVPLMALHEHNEQRATDRILRLLAQGESVALVSDAGTPAVSDPGAVAVARVREAGFRVVPVPGASAAMCALSVAGSTAPHVLIYGFLPARAAARRRELETLGPAPYLIVFFEAPHRVVASVTDMAEVFGADRAVTIARELTKLYESIHRCRLGEAGAWFAADANRVRGEFVLLVEPAAPSASADAGEAQRVLAILLRELPLKQAVKLAAQIAGGRRNELYELALAMKKAVNRD